MPVVLSKKNYSKVFKCIYWLSTSLLENMRNTVFGTHLICLFVLSFYEKNKKQLLITLPMAIVKSDTPKIAIG